MSMRDIEDKVESFLAKNAGSWHRSGKIAEAVQANESIPLSSVYLAVSNLAKQKRILRKHAEGTKTFVYSNNPQAGPRPKPIQSHRYPPKRVAQIHWTVQEKSQMANEYVRLRADFPHLSSAQAVTQMQLVLPKDRRRAFVRKVTDVPWLNDYVDATKKTATVPQASIKTEEEFSGPPKPHYDILEHIKQREEEISAQQPTVEINAVDPVLEETPDPAKKLASLESFGLDEIIGEALNRISIPLKSLLVRVLTDPAIKEALTLRTEVVVHHHHHHHSVVQNNEVIESVERQAEAKPPRPKIGVVGNRADMEHELSKAFPHIKFVVTDKKYHDAADAVKNCDRVILLTKFIGHATQNSVKSAAGDKITMVNGGISDVKRMVYLWMNEGSLPKQ